MKSSRNPKPLAMLLASFCLCAAHGQNETATLPAFPGAEGFGSTTPGGRGGKVLLVTNLNVCARRAK
jgi:hypothetical protein